MPSRCRVLRKDFMIDPYQVTEARAWGADCILLIMAMLDDETARILFSLARDYHAMDVLVEVHDEREVDRALGLGAEMIGINNLVLHCFVTDLGFTLRLARRITQDILVVAESGLSTPADLARLAAIGVTTVLIGESLMRQSSDVAAATSRAARKLSSIPSHNSSSIGRMAKLTHLDDKGAARMVDVSAKAATTRAAEEPRPIACCRAAAFAAAISGNAKKGDVLGAARIAGIMAAKKTADLIPLCHPIALTRATVDFKPRSATRSAIRIRATASTTGPTGVEMEALTAASVAALTIYDMIKAVDRSAVIETIRLLSKSGGKSGRYKAPAR